MKRQSVTRQDIALDHATRMAGGQFVDPTMAGFATFDLLLSDGTPLWQVELTTHERDELWAGHTLAVWANEAKRIDRIVALTHHYAGVKLDSDDTPQDEADDTPQDEWERFWCGQEPTKTGRVKRARIN